MAFNFGNKIVKTAKHFKNKIHQMKIDYKIFTEIKNKEYINPSNRITPENMKYNPYFWKDELKRKFMDVIEKLSKKNFQKMKMLDKDETSHPIAKRINEHAHNLANYAKKSALSIIESIKELIVKISNNYLDIKNFNSTQIAKAIKNIPLNIVNLVNVRVLIATYHKMGNYLSRLNRETVRYMILDLVWNSLLQILH